MNKASEERSDAELNFLPYAIKSLELPDIINNLLERLNASSFAKLLDLLRISSFTDTQGEELPAGELLNRIITYLRQKYELISIQPYWRERISDIKMLLSRLFSDIGTRINYNDLSRPKVALINTLLTSLLSPEILLLFKQLLQDLLKDTPPLKAIVSALGSVFS